MKFCRDVTNRGFTILQFKDSYDEVCDIQRSSTADDDCVWVGIHDPHPQILASKVKPGGTGWIDYDMPNGILITHRMHLTRKLSVALALKLLKFGLFNKI